MNELIGPMDPKQCDLKDLSPICGRVDLRASDTEVTSLERNSAGNNSSLGIVCAWSRATLVLVATNLTNVSSVFNTRYTSNRSFYNMIIGLNCLCI